MRSRLALALGLLFCGLENVLPAQEARSPFEAPTIQQLRIPFRRLADLDLDGDVDAVGALSEYNHRGRYRFAAFRNTQGQFSGGYWESQAQGEGSILIEVGHLNQDAWPDVCVLWGNYREDWLGTGNGTFPSTPTTTQLPEASEAMALGDVDRDGVDDLAWMSAGALHLATSTGAADSIAVGGTKHSLRLLAGNGPVGSDVFVAHVNDDVRLFYGHATTGLVAGPVFPTGVPMGMVDTGDIDGDGDVDAVVFGMHSYRVLRRLSRQNWVLESEVSGGPAQFLRDADGDGDLDGVCCSTGDGGDDGGPTYKPPLFPSRFEIAINDGHGGFAPAFALPSVGAEEIAGVADVDLDGDIDLVAGLCVYYADGVIRPRRTSAIVPPCASRRALSDCDGDGDMDVGFSAQSVFTNDGHGSFSEEAMGVRAPHRTQFLGPGYPGDFDGDGDDDLVVELAPDARVAGAPSAGGHGAANRMALLCNDGLGGLAPAVPAAPPGVTFGIDSPDPNLSLLADIDRDGDLDLLTRSASVVFAESETRAWANDGAGTFLPAGRLAVYRALWAGDVDRDGDLDLMAGASGYEGTSTYLLLGSQPRAERLPRMTWSGILWHQESTAGLEEADMDGDGRADFGVAAQEWYFGVPPTLARIFPGLLMNRLGSGGSLVMNSALDSANSEYHFARAERVSLGNLLGDDRPDALVGPLDFEGVTLCVVARRRGAALPAFDSIIQAVPAGILVDLDGDGALDILGEDIVFHR